jgi:HEAT repeat protein
MRTKALLAVTFLLAAVVAARWLAPSRGSAAASASTDPRLSQVDRLAADGDWSALAGRAASVDEAVAIAAVRALGRGGRGSVAYAERALSDARPSVRCAAAVALAQAGTRQQADAVAGVLDRDTDPTVRGAAATALGRLRAFDHMEHLFAAMDDPDATVRARAARAVERITGIRFRFDPLGPRAQRLKAIEAHRRDWQQLKDHASQYWSAVSE